MALDMARKISFKPTSRRSSHVRTARDRIARHWTRYCALQSICPGDTGFRHPQGKRTASGPPGRSVRTVGFFTDGHGQGPRGAHSDFACRAEPGACARTRVPRLAAPVCQEGCGGLRSDLLPGWRLVDRRIFGKFAGPGRLAPCGPSCRATGSVAARHANCRSAGGAARCGGRRAARGAYGRPYRIRALAGLPGRVTPMYLRTAFAHPGAPHVLQPAA
jgi:hypothetical protein